MNAPSLYDQMAVTVPEGAHGAVRVRRFEVPKRPDITSLRDILDGRSCRPGTYTRLDRGGVLWMSDTTAERRDHAGAALEIRKRGGRVLIGGLGLGMIVNFALLQDRVAHVDVVEIDPDVLALVGSHYADLARDHGKTITFHEADVFSITWPRGARWQVAWFDVWPDLCADNLPAMSRLRRSYGQRANWTGCWGQDFLRRRG